MTKLSDFRLAFGRGLIVSLSGRKVERRTLHLCHAASVESRDVVPVRNNSCLIERVHSFSGVWAVAGNNDVNPVWHVRLH